MWEGRGWGGPSWAGEGQASMLGRVWPVCRPERRLPVLVPLKSAEYATNHCMSLEANSSPVKVQMRS